MPSEERWMILPDHPAYRCSDYGRVQSKKRRGNQGPIYEWHDLKPRVKKSGHIAYALSEKSKLTYFDAHVLVLTLFVGPCPPGLEGCHKDGNPANNHVGNLRWGTHASNMADMVRHGTPFRGERHPKAKLTEEQAKEILSLKGIISARKLAPRYGIHYSSILFIWSGENWKHLQIPAAADQSG